MFIQVKEPVPVFDFFQDKTLLTAFQKPPDQRLPNERKFLSDFLESLSPIKQIAQDFTDQKDFLSRFSDKLSCKRFPEGAVLQDKGQKCEEMLIIVKGKVNVYDLKHHKQVAKQMNVWETQIKAFHKSKNTKVKKLTTKMSYKESRSSSSNPSVEMLTQSVMSFVTDGNNTDNQPRTPVGQPTNHRRLSSQCSIMSIPQEMQIMENKSKKRLDTGPTVRNESEGPDLNYDHLPEEEQFLLKNKGLKKKYVNNGASLLYCHSVLAQGTTINDNCFVKEYRSRFVVVAAEPLEVVSMAKISFQEVFQEEFERQSEKKRFFGNFFNQSRQFSNVFLAYIIERTYDVNDKIYEKDDEVDGLYFIKEGEVKFSVTLDSYEGAQSGFLKIYKPEEIEGKLERKEQSNSPLRKEIIGTEWLRGIKWNQGSSKEGLFGFRSPSVKKEKAIVGMLGEGNAFGEEGLYCEKKRRNFSAFAATSVVKVYFLSSKYYNMIQIMYPTLVHVLREKAESQNKWLNARVKEIKGVQGLVGEVALPTKPRNPEDLITRNFRYSKFIRGRVYNESKAIMSHRQSSPDSKTVDEVKMKHQGFLKVLNNAMKGKKQQRYLAKRIQNLSPSKSPNSHKHYLGQSLEIEFWKSKNENEEDAEKSPPPRNAYISLHKKVQSLRDKVPSLNIVGESYTDRATSFVGYDLLEEKQTPGTPIFPSKFVYISSPGSGSSSPRVLDQKLDISLSLANKPSVVLPTLEYALITNENSLPLRASSASSGRRDPNNLELSRDEVESPIAEFERYKPEEGVNWHLGSLTERIIKRSKSPKLKAERGRSSRASSNNLPELKIFSRSRSRSPIEVPEALEMRNQNGEQRGVEETEEGVIPGKKKQRTMVSSNHNMFRLKPKRPALLSHIYKPQQSLPSLVEGRSQERNSLFAFNCAFV